MLSQFAEAGIPVLLVGVSAWGAALAVGVGDDHVYGSRLTGRRNGGVDIAASRGLNRSRRVPHQNPGSEYEVRTVDGKSATAGNASRIRNNAANTWRGGGNVVEPARKSTALAVDVCDHYIGGSQGMSRGGSSDSAAVRDDDRGTKRTPHPYYCALTEAASLNSNRIAAIDRAAAGHRRSHTGWPWRSGIGKGTP